MILTTHGRNHHSPISGRPHCGHRRYALCSDSFAGYTGPLPTYLDMFCHNVSEIAKAFTS